MGMNRCTDEALMAKTPKPGGSKGSKGSGGAGDKHSPWGKAAADAVLTEVVRRTDAFCAEHLDEEYAELCRMLAGDLARKRPSPLLRGKPEGWAAGIIYTVGWVNFLSDPSQTPHMKSADLFRLTGVSGATVQARSSEIRKMFKLMALEPRLTRTSLLADNPMVWMVMLDNGMIDDARRFPRSVQQELVDQGILPFVHPHAVDDLGEESDDEEEDGEDGPSSNGKGNPCP
jgi:hypothetical protein